MDSQKLPSTENVTGSNSDFSVGNILSEAWAKTSGLKGAYWGAFLIIAAIMLVAYLVAGYISIQFEGPFTKENHAFRPIGTALQLLISVFIGTPLFAGLLMLAIKHLKGLPINFAMAFQYYSYWKKLWVLPVIFTVLNVIPQLIPNLIVSLLVFIASIYVSISFILYTPLIVDKKLDIAPALEGSRKSISPHWFKTFGLIFVMALIIAVSALPLLIGLIWTLPMMSNVIALLYRSFYTLEGN